MDMATQYEPLWLICSKCGCRRPPHTQKSGRCLDKMLCLRLERDRLDIRNLSETQNSPR